MLNQYARRQQVKRDGLSARDLRAVRGAACAAVGVPFGPVLLGHDCRDLAEGATAQGEAVQWVVTDNRQAIVPAAAM